MKKIILMLIICAFAANSFAAIKRIGYWGNPVTGVDFATPALAVTACVDGDTIYVYGNNSGAGWDINLTKRLVIIGTGYWYAVNTPSNTNFNANLQNYTLYSWARVQLSDGSGNSIITGIVGYVYVSQSHTAPINNIRISNCHWNSYTTMYKNGMTYDGWEISKCYISGNIGFPYTQTAKVTNFKFFNNIMHNTGLFFSSLAGQTGIIENCIFYSSVTLGCPFSCVNYGFNISGINLLIQNSILTNSPNLTGYNNSVFNNCIFDYTPGGLFGSNNIFNANNANIYVGLPTMGSFSDDARWALKAGSPAIGAGIGGLDCGVFGGVNPYKLSGMPAVPAFYKLTAPGTSASTNPYTITFSVKGNN